MNQELTKTEAQEELKQLEQRLWSQLEYLEERIRRLERARAKNYWIGDSRYFVRIV